MSAVEESDDFQVENFASPKYWEDFFRRQGNTFEWYTDADTFLTVLKSYLKLSDNILQIGCGTSTLADALYDGGFKNIVSVDIVKEAIKKQSSRNRRRRPELKFICADATNLNFSDGQKFGAVIDKGTVDSLIPVQGDKYLKTVREMFAQVDKVLATNGRYAVVSLCQPMVVEAWLGFFLDKNYILRAERVIQKNSDKSNTFDLPVFCLVATKLRVPLKAPIMELRSGQDMARFSSQELFVEALRRAQQYHKIACDVRYSKLNEEVKVEFHASFHGKSINPFTVYIIDSLHTQQYKFQYAVFIVPPDRRKQWMFYTREGRLHLCKLCQSHRIAIAFAEGKREDFDAETFKRDLNSIAMDFAPADMTQEIVFLSAAPDSVVGEVLETGESQYSGQYEVRNETCDDQRRRTLRFLANETVTQSEAFLTGDEDSIDHINLACKHHSVFVQLLELYQSDHPQPADDCRLLIIGLGGGCLPMHIRARFGQVTIVAVEIDPAMVEVAKRWFSFVDDDKMEVVIEGGLEYMSKAVEREELFDMIFVDVAGSEIVDNLVAPLPEFVQYDTLLQYRALLKENGISCINFLCYDHLKMLQIRDDVLHVFSSAYSLLISKELNEILILAKVHETDRAKQALRRLCDEFNNKLRLID